MRREAGFFQPELEGMGPEERRRYKERRLREVVEHAWSHSPAFRGRLEAVGLGPGDLRSLEDLGRLPFLRKSQMVDLQGADPPFGGLVAVSPGKIWRICISPGPIYEPWDFDYRDIRWAQALYAMGVRQGDVLQNTFSYHMVIFAHWLDEAARQLRCTIIPMGPGNSEVQVRVMKTLGTTVFLGTPSFLLTLAEKARQMGFHPRRDLSLEVAFVAAERLPESLREELEDAFGAMVRQAYGTADVGCLGYECVHKRGMHIPEDCIVEIVDPATGEVLPPGEVGEVVATTFDPAYPLIRFGTGDLSYIEEGECPCGRSSPRLMKILGRVDDLVKVRGMFIHPSQVDEIPLKVPQVERCQVLVTRHQRQDRILLRVELVPEAQGEELQAVLEGVAREVFKLRCEVEILPRGTLPEGFKKLEDRRVWED